MLHNEWLTHCNVFHDFIFETILSKIGRRILAELGLDIYGDIRSIRVSFIFEQVYMAVKMVSGKTVLR